MALDGVSKLGSFIGEIKSDQGTLQENISPNEENPIDTLFFSERLQTSSVVSLFQSRMSDVLIVQHPIFGVIETGAYPIGPFCVLDHPKYAFLDDCMLADTGEEFEKTQMNMYDVDSNILLTNILPLQTTDISDNTAILNALLI